MKFKANLQYKPANFQMDDCRIEKVVELSYEDFCRLKIAPLEDQAFIAENKDCMFSRDGIAHCLLALSQESRDGVLIESEGYDYPRYAAYIPGMRDIVNAELERAAEFIIRQGIENAGSVSFEEVEGQLGLTVQEGNGLDEMLKAVLERRPKVAAVAMREGCIQMEYYPEFCQMSRNEPEQTMGPVMGWSTTM